MFSFFSISTPFLAFLIALISKYILYRKCSVTAWQCINNVSQIFQGKEQG